LERRQEALRRRPQGFLPDCNQRQETNMNQVLNSSKWEDTFPSLVIAIVLTLLLWGPLAMLVGSAVGMVAFVLIYRKRLRTSGWLIASIAATVSAVLAAAVAIALSLPQPR
jgi:hypothetical protein